MYEATQASALGELVQAHHELLFVHHRVVAATESVPRREAAGWKGPAAIAFQWALDEIERELAHATDLLRVAGELTVAAVAELGGHV
jgi:hypothetical protein